jgi:hypothetical protein
MMAPWVSAHASTLHLPLEVSEGSSDRARVTA